MGTSGTPFFRFCVGLLLVVAVALVHTALQNATARLRQQSALQEARRQALERDRQELWVLWRAARTRSVDAARNRGDAIAAEGASSPAGSVVSGGEADGNIGDSRAASSAGRSGAHAADRATGRTSATARFR
ncbi:MAG: hypothetical protein D6725_13235 [Planctomycetota bacterium]|nr:MAG: hypothetical protein D6725_13235 [Planctomycetota bacterium]